MRKISENGIKQIKLHEGEVLVGYLDVAGFLTIGVGHLVKAGEPYKFGESITREESNRLLLKDLRDAEWGVNKNVKVPLTQNQYDALVSLVFNIGTSNFRNSTLLRRLNEGDYAGAAQQFGRWIHAGGKRSKGLIYRRSAERKLFETPGKPSTAQTKNLAENGNNPVVVFSNTTSSPTPKSVTEAPQIMAEPSAPQQVGLEAASEVIKSNTPINTGERENVTGIWKEFIGVIVRYLFVAAFGVLVSNNVITREMADLLLESSVGYAIAGLVILIPLAWAWAKLRFNQYVIQQAADAPPGTSVDAIKARVAKTKTALPI